MQYRVEILDAVTSKHTEWDSYNDEGFAIGAAARLVWTDEAIEAKDRQGRSSRIGRHWI